MSCHVLHLDSLFEPEVAKDGDLQGDRGCIPSAAQRLNGKPPRPCGGKPGCSSLLSGAESAAISSSIDDRASRNPWHGAAFFCACIQHSVELLMSRLAQMHMAALTSNVAFKPFSAPTHVTAACTKMLSGVGQEPAAAIWMHPQQQLRRRQRNCSILAKIIAHARQMNFKSSRLCLFKAASRYPGSSSANMCQRTNDKLRSGGSQWWQPMLSLYPQPRR